MDDPTWVLVMRPGLVPDRKGPFRDKRLVEDMLRGLYDLYPDCLCIVIDMPTTSYPQSAREWLDMYGDTLEDIKRELEESSGQPMPTATPINIARNTQ